MINNQSSVLILYNRDRHFFNVTCQKQRNIFFLHVIKLLNVCKNMKIFIEFILSRRIVLLLKYLNEPTI